MSSVDRPEVSIIVTAYNIAAYLGEALGSVFDQGIKAEIIVVDDGSTDRTIPIAKRLLKLAPKSLLLTQPNAGAGAARNNGLRQASGEYVVFLDGDDWLAEGAVAALLARAKQTNADIVLSNRKRYWERSGRFTSQPLFKQAEEGSPPDIPLIMGIFAIHGKIFKRQFLIDNEIIFPEGMSSEDFVHGYHCYAVAERVATLPLVTYYYRKRGDAANKSVTQARLSEFNLQSRFRQINLTQALVDRYAMRDRFPKVPFARRDYHARLMRHVKLIPDADVKTRGRSLELVRAFLIESGDRALAASPLSTRRIYRAIIKGKYRSALKLIQEAP